MINFLCIVLIGMMMLLTPSPSHASKTHKVKKNESLYTIAKKYHVHVNDLKAANNLVNNHIRNGDKLVIPAGVATDSGGSHGKKTKYSGDTYRVRKGDTLATVAKRTGVSIRELKRLNSLGKARLKPGRVLALRDAEEFDEAKAKAARRIAIRTNDLFNEKDYEQSLAELTEPENDQDVDLSKNTELKTDNVALLKSKAFSFLGTHYRFGGNSLRGIDCSAFVQQVFRKMEVSLPRTAREQYEIGSEVAPGDLQKGDLVFFRTYASYPSHVGIYLGGSKMIHASSRDRRVVISTMDTPYYRSRFIGAKRIAKINPDVFRFDDLFTGVEEETASDASANDSLDIGSER
jgi:peptidoglycan DL-endopeptidase LytE